ncbi:MAG: hypothetical protein ABIO86_12935 [Sphingomonas sp.]
MAHQRSALRALVFALCLTLGGGQAVAAPKHNMWNWDDILAPPLVEAESVECSATHPVRTVPDFRDGLIATYTFGISKDHGRLDGLVEEINEPVPRNGYDEPPFRHAVLAFPKHLPKGPAEITVDDNVVLTNMDDLLDRYGRVCQASREEPLMLRSIAYRRATLRERAEAPPREHWYMGEVPFQPVPIAPAADGGEFLPEAVPGGEFRFVTTPDSATTEPGVLPLDPPYGWTFDSGKVVRGAGVHLAALFAGHETLESLGLMADAGFDVMTLERAGRIETLVIDPSLLDSDAKMRERTKLVVQFGNSFRFDLRGMRVVFFPADAGAIDALRLESSQRELLKHYVIDLQVQSVAAGFAKSRGIPDDREVAKIIAAEWTRFSGAAQEAGYASLFGPAGTSVGGLHDLMCEPDGQVFDCIAGVTFLAAGHPKYARHSLIFERFRAPDGAWQLKRHDPPGPKTDPTQTPLVVPVAHDADGPDILPSVAEVEHFLKSSWAHLPLTSITGNLSGTDDSIEAGLDGHFGTRGTIFGEVHDLACTAQDRVFTCKIGVTLLLGSEPQYEQAQIDFSRVRRDDGVWELKYFYVPDIIVTNGQRSTDTQG